MAVQANWHVGDLGVADDDTDPFGDGPRPIEQVGTPIDLSQGKATLNDELVRLLEREGQLFNRGVTCPLKEHSDMTCSVCPLSQDGTGGELAALCAIGKEQEVVLSKLVASRHGG